MRPEPLQRTLAARGAVLDDRTEPGRVLHFGDPGSEIAACPAGALLDASRRQRVWLEGKDRVDVLNGQCTNDVRLVEESRSIRAVLTTPKGRVIDLVQVFARGDALGVVGSENTDPELPSLLSAKIIIEDCSVRRADDVVPLLAFGAAAPEAVTRVLGRAPGPHGDHFEAVQGEFAGRAVPCLGTRAPGGHGILVLAAEDDAGELYAALADSGKLTPVGDQAYEQVRIEAGLPVLGKDMGDHTNPLESGLDDSVSFTKGCYVGQEVVARLNNYRKVKRRLMGLRFAADADPTHLDEIFWDLLRIGQVTSATRSARLGATLALALIKSDYAAPGTAIYSVKDGERIDGEVCELPFA
jgi:folate-binding protein YgfZ